MTIAARLEDATAIDGMDREARRTLRLETTGTIATGNTAEVRIHNISSTGLLLETEAELAVGERLAIDLPLAGDCWASVVWCSGRFFGCQFDAPVSQAALSAVELRSEAGAESGDAASVDSSFGLRLQRLRRDRGLTLAQIATRLGVSRPTVWAWEHGKARPVERRVAAIAELLGVTKAELVQTTQATGQDSLLARSRDQIAAVYGIPPERVKIWIEL